MILQLSKIKNVAITITIMDITISTGSTMMRKGIGTMVKNTNTPKIAP